MKATITDNHFHADIKAPFGNSYYGNHFYVNAYLKVGEAFTAWFCRSNSDIESVHVPGTDYVGQEPVLNPNFFNGCIEEVMIPSCGSMAEAAGKVMATFYDFTEQQLAKNDCPPRKEVRLKVEVG